MNPHLFMTCSLWAIIGAIYFLSVIDKTDLKEIKLYKRILLILIGGPLIWIGLFLILIFQLLAKTLKFWE